MADSKKKTTKPKVEGTELPDGTNLEEQVARLNSQWGGEGRGTTVDHVDATAPDENTELEKELNPALGEDDDEEVADELEIEADGDDEDDGIPVYEELTRDEVPLPKKNCMRCTHLLPNHPEGADRERTEKVYKLVKGGAHTGYYKESKQRVTVPAKATAFPCFSEAICPARVIVMPFDPYTPEVLSAKVDEWMEGGDASVLSNLYAEADAVSPALHERVHASVMELIASRMLGGGAPVETADEIAD